MTNLLNILLYSCLIFTKMDSSFTFIFLRCKEGQGEGREEGGDHPGGKEGRGDGDDWLVESQTCHAPPHLTDQGRATLVVEKADVGEGPEEENHHSEGDGLGDCGVHHSEVVVDDEDSKELREERLSEEKTTPY